MVKKTITISKLFP